MKLTREILVLAALLLSVSGVVSAQVPTGTPPFGSAGSGPVDTIDLANLNVHFSIPTLSKAGRGLSFTYPLGYDTSIYYPVGSSGSQIWTQVSNLGWTGITPIEPGFLTANITTVTLNCNVGGGHFLRGIQSTYTNWAYHDHRNTAHPFIGTAVSQPSYCGTAYTGFTNTSTDGAGHTLSTQSLFSNPVTTRTGTNLEAAVGSTPVSTDTNGNEITTNSSGVITDTLGNTLTIAGSGTPSSPITLTYVAPSGANAAYTVKYTAYTVRTKFGCSGIAEWGPNTIDLVSEIDLPDQSVVASDKYTFTYEATPGYSGDITGRLASITLPTGGTITYTYTGGTNGIECADGSTAGLTRATPDGTWTYSRTLGTGGASTTTITDPQGNQTVVSSVGIYPTETQVYQGSASSGTLLKTTYTCYNGATSPCNSTGIALPITEKTASLQWPAGLESKTNTFYNSTYGMVTEVDEYAYGSGAPGALVRKTLTTYASLTNGIVSKPASVTVEDGSGNIKSQSTFCYDEGTPSGTTSCAAAGSPTATSGTPQHISITGSRGNLTTMASLVSGSTIHAKTFTYYDTGNINVATDVNGAQITLNYGSSSCGNSFPTSVSEPLSLSKSMVWNCTGGVATSATDENGKTTSASYTDAYYWRPMTGPSFCTTGSERVYIRKPSVQFAARREP